MSRSAWIAVLALMLLILVASAAGLGWFLMSSSARRAEERFADLEALERDRRAWIEEQARLAARAAREGAEITPARSEPASPDSGSERAREGTGAAKDGADLAVRFGDSSHHHALSRVAWGRFASDVLELHREFEAAEGDAAELDELASKYADFIARLSAALPAGLGGRAPGFDAITHPLVLANLVAAVLDAVESPIDEAQSARFAEIGEAYEAEAESLHSSFSDDIGALTRILHELALERDTSAQFLSVLDAQQRIAVGLSDAESVLGANLLSPERSLDFVEVAVASGDDALAAFDAHMRALGVDSVPASIRDAWAESAADFVDGGAGGRSVLESAIAAGWAQARVFEQIAAATDDAALRERLLGARRVLLPVLVASD